MVFYSLFLLVLLEDVKLELLVLVGHEPELGDERGRVHLPVVVAKLGCKRSQRHGS